MERRGARARFDECDRQNGRVAEALESALDRVRAELLDDDKLIRAVAAGRRRGERPAYRRAELRWVDLRDGRRLQVVTYDDRQAFTSNVEPENAAAAVQDLLAEPYGNWHVETTAGTTQLRVTKNGEAQVHRSAMQGAAEPVRSHDRAKARLLDPTDPFLRAVGISDNRGRIKPSRMDKYRQVEEFLRAIEPVLGRARAAAGDGPLRIVDLGCGNAYLTFAAYRWLTDRHGLDVRLVGVDVKSQARRRNTDLAAVLGWADAVRSSKERSRTPMSVSHLMSCSLSMPVTRQPTTLWLVRCDGSLLLCWRRRVVTTTCSANCPMSRPRLLTGR